jgi:hypothetical protein
MSETTVDGQRPTPAPREQNLRWALRQVEEALRDLRFGALTLLVQDGVIVQVERTERHRYRRQTDQASAESPE